MTESELRALFKPDKYGFCRVELNGKTEGFWFDTVLKVTEVVDDAWSCCIDCGALWMTNPVVCACGGTEFDIYYQGERL